MLIWCSYCQQFQGEIPPYEKFAITHGLCPACVDTGLDLTERDLAHIRTLKGIQGRLMEAGLCADLKAAEQIVRCAADANVRGTDMMAPILFEIGENWKRGVATVANEHRFTGFCEGVFELVSARVKTAEPGGARKAEQAEFVLVNASGNRHTLAIRILELWLVNKGGFNPKGFWFRWLSPNSARALSRSLSASLRGRTQSAQESLSEATRSRWAKSSRYRAPTSWLTSTRFESVEFASGEIHDTCLTPRMHKVRRPSQRIPIEPQRRPPRFPVPRTVWPGPSLRRTYSPG